MRIFKCTNLETSVRSRFTIKCGSARGCSAFLTQVTGDHFVSYMGVRIGGSRGGHAPHFPPILVLIQFL